MKSPIADPIINVFKPWYDTLGKCGEILYKVSTIDGSAIPFFI